MAETYTFTSTGDYRDSPTMSAKKAGDRAVADGRTAYNFTVGDVSNKPTEEEVTGWLGQLQADHAAAPDDLARKPLTFFEQLKYIPGAGPDGLRAAAAERYAQDFGIEITKDDIAVGIGGKGALQGVGSTFAAGDKVIVGAPGWPTNYDIFAKDVQLIEVDTGGTGLIQANALREVLAAHPDAKGILINSPSNPTGAKYSADEREEVMGVLKEHADVVVMSDNPYGRLVFDGSTLECGPHERDIWDEGRLVIFRSMSKEYGMAGLRTGFAIAKNLDPEKKPTRFTKGVVKHNENEGGLAGPCMNIAQAALLYGEPYIERNIEDLKQKRQLMFGQVMGSAEAPGLATLEMELPQATIYGWINMERLKGLEIPEGWMIDGAARTIATPQDAYDFAVEMGGINGVLGQSSYAPGSTSAASDWHTRFTFAGDSAQIEAGFAKYREVETALLKYNREIGNLHGELQNWRDDQLGTSDDIQF